MRIAAKRFASLVLIPGCVAALAAASAVDEAGACGRGIETVRGAMERTRLDPQERQAAEAAVAAAVAALADGDGAACDAHLHRAKVILHLEH
jgi:hypothetical protein